MRERSYYRVNLPNFSTYLLIIVNYEPFTIYIYTKLVDIGDNVFYF